MDPGTDTSAGSRGGYSIATLAGELDISCAPALRERLFGLLAASNRIVVDMSGVSGCDASGLAVLVGTARRAERLGGVLRLAAPAPQVAKVIRVTGLDRRLETFATVEAATASAPGGRVGPYGTAGLTAVSASRIERTLSAPRGMGIWFIHPM